MHFVSPLSAIETVDLELVLAVDDSLPMFEGNSFEGTLRVINIPGDDANSFGRLVTDARDDAIAAGLADRGRRIVADGIQFVTEASCDTGG